MKLICVKHKNSLDVVHVDKLHAVDCPWNVVGSYDLLTLRLTATHHIKFSYLIKRSF